MKKGLLGCLGISAVLVLVGGIGFYYFVYKPFLSDYVGGFVQLAEVVELNEKVENTSPYTPPDDGELSEAQVDRFMEVQSQVKNDLGQRFEALQAKYDQLQAELDQEGRDANYREVLNAWRDLSDLLVEAKETQVKALNEAGFSLEEYRWVRWQSYRAAGVSTPPYALSDIVDAAKQGETDFSNIQESWRGDQEVPAHNRELIQRYANQLEETAGFAWFGL